MDIVIDTLIEDLLVVEIHRYGIRTKVPKSRNWIANVLPSLDDNRFTQMLRINREIFVYILSMIEKDPVFHGENSQLQLPVEIQLAIVLFRLGSSGEAASVRKMAAIFGVGDGGTFDKILHRVFKVGK